MLLCRTLTTSVYNEEADYKQRNAKLIETVDMHRNALVAIREKLALFEDLKRERDQLRTQERQADQQRSQLQAAIDATNQRMTSLVDAHAARENQLHAQNKNLKDEIEATKQQCADQINNKQQLINQMIAAAAKTKTDHNAEKEDDAQKWLDTRQEMIEERYTENLQH